MASLDKAGLTYLWSKLKAKLNGKADAVHTHSASDVSGLSKVATSNNYNDLSNKPSIPTIPSSLPANGGNADTVDGYHIRTGTSGADGYITFVL